MTTIEGIRAGLATNLEAISGLRTATEIPDNPNPPQAIIMLERREYDSAFAQGTSEYTFRITVLATRASERRAQAKLDTYTSNGPQSVKSAIESDRTLGGEVFDARVTEMSNYGTVSLGEVLYLAADFAVTVYAE